jgi:hypothetical protein
MPKWKKLCKEGEESTRSIAEKEFEDIFGIQTWYRGCNRQLCYSHVPEEWMPAVLELINKIRAKYKVVGLDVQINNVWGDVETEYSVRIDQIKDKFGSLRFYFTTADSTTYDDINEMVRECEEKLKHADLHYGVPY